MFTSSKSTSKTPSTSTTNFFYTTPPSYELSLEDFESFALSRLIVLRKIEELKVKGLDRNQYNDALKRVVSLQLPSGGSNQSQKSYNEKRDLASHFILRLAYCRTEELRRWLLTQELALFKFRLEDLEKRGGKDMTLFMRSAQISFDKISHDEKNGMQSELRFNMSYRDFEASSFYKIPFAEAVDLIGRRLVHVRGGYAYVPGGKLVSIICARFRSHLSRSLAKASASFSHVSSDTRIGPLLKNMNKQYTGRDFGKQTAVEGDMNASNVDEYAERSMPLCMRQVHDGLKKDHKLKHDGRRQYGLFLKGAGLTMEESLLFFQNEFTKIMSADDFNKNYAYNIRHSYGKEGKRQSYTAFSSTTIIMGPRSNPSEVGSHHGCPFAHSGDSSLAALLGKMGIGGKDKDDIMAHKKNKMYQLACAKHFEVTHPGAAKTEGVDLDGVGNHPNAWFNSSAQYWKQKDGVKKEGGLKGKLTPPKGKVERALVSPNRPGEEKMEINA
ncbi:hypothetical protein TrLO_g4236 [Triparma laevis f. longispina]|uniref:DNA primase large subunit n=1 Tax=Triparma laevis f. longispina TaxID=1714387 RepID=A0A9W7EDC3_9STRA|nr:hypothetical protein TrLO_g4236 [Triparma laevis f. longispina]